MTKATDFLHLLLKFIFYPVLVFSEIMVGRRVIEFNIHPPAVIYAIRVLNTKNKLIYIGKTTSESELRFKRHIYKSYMKKHNNKDLQKAIRDAHFAVTFDILETCSVKKAHEREAYYIQKYNSKFLCNNIIPVKYQELSE